MKSNLNNTCSYSISLPFSPTKIEELTAGSDGQLGERREFTRSPCHGFVAQWMERLTGNWKTQVRSPAGLRCVFSSDPAVSSSVFVGENGREFDQDPDKSEFSTCSNCWPLLLWVEHSENKDHCHTKHAWLWFSLLVQNQVQAYVAWINSHLRKREGVKLLEDMQRDMSDGITLVNLVEVVCKF